MILDFSPETDYPSLKWHLPFHSLVFKWGDLETVRVFLMCRNDDCYLFHTGLLDGRNTLYINAFLVIPSCMKWTLWGIILTLYYMRGGQEKIKKILFFFNSSGIKSTLTSREISIFFSLWFNNCRVLDNYRWEKAFRIICAFSLENFWHMQNGKLVISMQGFRLFLSHRTVSFNLLSTACWRNKGSLCFPTNQLTYIFSVTAPVFTQKKGVLKAKQQQQQNSS